MTGAAHFSKFSGLRWHAFWEDAGNRRFARRAILWAALAFAFLYPLLSMATHDIRVGIDMQEVRCLPWRVYLMKLGRPQSFDKGAFVAFKPRNGLMGPAFEGRLVGKMIAGVPGDVLEVKQDVAYVNGKRVGDLILLPKLHAKPGAFDRREVVPAGKLLVLGTEPRSYDGRYWGFLDQSAVIGTVKPLF
ncbi:S26 family signal peptidase [Noviherbaspirillum pedocola]|uniref:S26 family signal peptidase n=1 Tax=Noviherbaspirillum pedocola TaxID=2801341 RepID=A0A934W3V0_9BURK|nr:S26 family signal peptidase [Noviherbaspirillum pedocola]MBK4737831.1 S26 family signal peptidase [Noviherbaspirillum pedocola]